MSISMVGESLAVSRQVGMLVRTLGSERGGFREEDKLPFIRMWKPSPRKRVLRPKWISGRGQTTIYKGVETFS